MSASTSLPAEICFDTPSGRLCIPLTGTGPTAPATRGDTIDLADRLTMSHVASDLRRLLDFEAILVETVKAHDGALAHREHLARVLAAEAHEVFERAETACLRGGASLSRFSGVIAQRIASACEHDHLPQPMRDALAQWRQRHPDLALHIAGLPAAAVVSILGHRESVSGALADFVAGKPPTVQLACEGSKGSCAILGYLTGAAVLLGNVPAAAVGVASIGWCCG
jgi:hypothetical protein